MSRLRRILVPVAVFAAVVGGCVGGEETTADRPPAGDAAAPEEPAPEEPAAVEASASPDVPELHPAIDGLDEVVVTIAAEGAAGAVRVDAKLADDDAERGRGLMEVPSLPAGSGMLFVYEEDRTGGFWMRDTLVPLDIAYLDARGEIVDVLAMDPCESVEASDCPVYTPDTPYRAALEVPQGWFASVGVAAGDVVAWSEPVPVG